MTDRQLLQLTKRLHSHLAKAYVLYTDIKCGDHPLAAEIGRSLDGNGIGYSWDVEGIVRDHLAARAEECEAEASETMEDHLREG